MELERRLLSVANSSYMLSRDMAVNEGISFEESNSRNSRQGEEGKDLVPSNTSKCLQPKPVFL